MTERTAQRLIYALIVAGFVAALVGLTVAALLDPVGA